MIQKIKAYLRLVWGIGTVHCGYPYWHPAHVWKERVYDDMFNDEIVVRKQCGGS